MRAIELLREISKLTAVEAVDTQPGHLPYLEIEDSKGDGSTLPFTVKDGKNWKIKSGIPAPEASFNVFASRVGKSRIAEVDRESAYQDFLVAQANYETGFRHSDHPISLSLRKSREPFHSFCKPEDSP